MAGKRGDTLKNPTPTAGAAKKTVDAVLGAIKLGNGAVSLLAGLLASVMILYSGYVLYDSFSTEYQAYSSAWDLLKYKPDAGSEEPSAGTELLAEINEDYRAWLTIYDTTIDYPVVQGENDLYYASHNIYKEVSLTGAIYLAAGNKRDFSDSYNVIFGHHMDNGAMFGSLDKYKDEAYFRAHSTGIVVAESGNYDLKLFAVITTDAYENQIYATGNRAKDVLSFLTGDRSKDAGVGTKVLIYDDDTAKDTDKIIALSTCADAETNGRLVVLGRLTKREDDGKNEEDNDDKEKDDENKDDGKTDDGSKDNKDDGKKNNGNKGDSTNGGTGKKNDQKEDTTAAGKAHNLTIRYLFLDGSTAAETYREMKMPGEEYSREIPDIPGFVTARIIVHGTMGNTEEEVVVFYIPEDMADKGDTIAIIEDPVPLGLDHQYAQMGICVE